MPTRRYLFHSDDASYDAVTKKYTFTLDRRVDRPTRIGVVKAQYCAATNNNDLPLVVYVRSDALSSTVLTKHTLRVKSENHEATENILVTLEESHTKGRYCLKKEDRFFTADNHKHLREIDFIFTDNTTPLGNAASGGSSGGSGGVTDATIEGFGADLLLWWDMAPARLLSSTFVPQSNPGDLVNYHYNRTPGPATLLFTTGYGAGLQIANVGQTLGVTRSGSWESILDNTQPNPQVADLHAFHTLVTMPPGINDHSYICNFPFMKWFTFAGGTINFRDENDNNTNVPLAWIPLRSYIISIQRRAGTADHNGDGSVNTHEFYWRMEDLTDGAVQTQTSSSSWPVTQATATNWSMGRASTQFSHIQSCCILYNGEDSTKWDNSIAWLRQKFTGTAASPDEPVVEATNQEWFVELEIETK